MRLAQGGAPKMNAALFSWFEAHRRDLAFRRTRDPYAVLVSEVMLQQTQATRVEPAWLAFMARFDTVDALASAAPADVIRTWGNLGYNGRAVRLQRAAQTVVAQHDGAVPPTLLALEALPGIGPYTARAVSAIAFGRPVAALDTNVGRVIRRLGGFAPSDPPRVLQRLADELVDKARPADWTHAMMDVGAALCRPREPRCGACPLARHCRTGRTAPADAASAAAPAHRRRPPGTARRRAVSARSAPAIPFPATRRWLRGRIVQRLRERPGRRWVSFDGPIGVHSADAVSVAIGHLAREGLLELDRVGRARLPQAASRQRTALGG